MSMQVQEGRQRKIINHDNPNEGKKRNICIDCSVHCSEGLSVLANVPGEELVEVRTISTERIRGGHERVVDRREG